MMQQAFSGGPTGLGPQPAPQQGTNLSLTPELIARVLAELQAQQAAAQQPQQPAPVAPGNDLAQLQQIMKQIGIGGAR